jgi:hypothetical protein
MLNVVRCRSNIAKAHRDNRIGNHTGEFTFVSTAESPLRSKNSGWIQFDEPFVEIAPVVLGFKKLDLDEGTSTISIDAYANNITTIGFTINADSPSDTRINEVSIQWMAIPPSIPSGETDFQAGFFGTLEVRPREDTLHVKNWKDIDFQEPFPALPNVVVWISSFDMSIKKSWRLGATATNIRPKGFTISVDTWSDSILYSANASWVAWPSSTRSTIGSYVRPQMVRQNTTGFDAGFANTTEVSFASAVASRTFPQVVSAFSQFDAATGEGLRIQTTNGVSARGMNVTTRSFGNTTVSNNFAVGWIAAT